jgi:hypothetical protein
MLPHPSSSHPTYPPRTPHPSANRKTAQTKKPTRSNARTWDEKTLGDPIPTKIKKDTKGKERLLQLLLQPLRPKPVATTNKTFDLLINRRYTEAYVKTGRVLVALLLPPALYLRVNF